VPAFSKLRWPPDGPVRSLLAYLDRLHRDAGQPSLSEIGRAVALAPSTLSAFFTGTRLISQGNLELVVSHLDGDVQRAERLRRKAATAWNAERPGPAGRSAARPVPSPSLAPVEEPPDPGARLDLLVFDTPANQLNRPDRLFGRQKLIDEIIPWLDRGERVLLHGMGGSGKTALAATLADQRLAAGGGRYLWLRTGGADEEVVFDALVRRFAMARDRERIGALIGDSRLVAIQDVIRGSGLTLCVFDDVWRPSALHSIVRAVPDGLPVWSPPG
jgi:hypothetical protein